MINVCAFGTVRMDIHIYDDCNLLENHEEIKVDEMALHVGGSVYNTVSVLNELKQDVVFYTLNVMDDIADYIKLKLINQGVTFITSKHDHNSMAKSIIVIDDKGNKRMISYDGVREDLYVLNKLSKSVRDYDLFYTSFYEINAGNIDLIIEIMKKAKQCFLDLSPLLYTIETRIVEDVLNYTRFISGTSDEYNQLMVKLNVKTIEQLIIRFGFKYLFEKKGSNGATLYYDNKIINCFPIEKLHSRNTTGCGDTFNAIVIDSMIKGVDENTMLRNAVNYASLVAYRGFSLDLFDNNNSGNKF